MTTLATRTPSTPAVITGEFVETAPTPPSLPSPPPEIAGERVYAHNPYLIDAVASRVCFFLATAGAVWPTYRDDPRADLAFGLAIGLLLAMALYTGRFNAWDRA